MTSAFEYLSTEEQGRVRPVGAPPVLEDFVFVLGSDRAGDVQRFAIGDKVVLEQTADVTGLKLVRFRATVRGPAVMPAIAYDLDAALSTPGTPNTAATDEAAAQVAAAPKWYLTWGVGNAVHGTRELLPGRTLTINDGAIDVSQVTGDQALRFTLKLVIDPGDPGYVAPATLPPGVLWAADFSETPAGVYAGLPALDLGLTRASGATVQTSAATLLAGIAADAARVYDNGSAHGLLVEEEREQHARSSLDLANVAWTLESGVVTPDATLGPDGVHAVHKIDVASGANALYQFPTLGEATFSYSEWIRAAGGASTYSTSFRANNGAVPAVASGAVPSAWTRVTTPPQAHASGGGYILPLSGRNDVAYGGPGAAARSALVTRAQLEPGAFPTSDIDNPGTAAVLRAGDYLFHTAFANLVFGGRLSLYLALHPLGARDELAGIVQLFNNNTNACYANIDGTTKHLFIGVNGVNIDMGLLPAWQRGDLVEIYIAAGGGVAPSRAKVRINGGGIVYLLTTGTVHGVVATGVDRLDLLCHATLGRQFSAALLRAATYNAGTVPEWAA